MAFGYSTSDMVFRSKGQGHRVTECKNILKVNQVANVNYALYQVPVSNYYCYYYFIVTMMMMMIIIIICCVADKCWRFLQQFGMKISLRLQTQFTETLAVCLTCRNISLTLRCMLCDSYTSGIVALEESPRHWGPVYKSLSLDLKSLKIVKYFAFCK